MGGLQADIGEVVAVRWLKYLATGPKHVLKSRGKMFAGYYVNKLNN